jgi:hypothetical protein
MRCELKSSFALWKKLCNSRAASWKMLKNLKMAIEIAS